MSLKFYLNKFLKVDNIENYTLGTLQELRKTYDEFLEASEGTDPDFPMIDFGQKGKKIKGTNVSKIEIDSPIREDGDDSISLTK
jgi:hypothetical protein